jgi:hypothetical protein
MKIFSEGELCRSLIRETPDAGADGVSLASIACRQTIIFPISNQRSVKGLSFKLRVERLGYVADGTLNFEIGICEMLEIRGMLFICGALHEIEVVMVCSDNSMQ